MADFTELRAALAERDALPPLGNMATPSERVRHLSKSNHANLGFMLAAVNAAPDLLRERDALAARVLELEADAGRWRALPEFLEEHQIDYMRLLRQVDAARGAT
tara:strand:- start:113 stop:424 length:312 start_codon:yes stop_codon:yes gene_type:complete